MSEASQVRLERQGDVAVVVIDNPPVNALGPGVREGIIAAVKQANADPDIRATVLLGAGRGFIAGADIRQFGKPRARPPLGQTIQDFLDGSAKPVMAAIHGYALGGGLEVALACHYRIAVASAKVGLPEVLIGIVPGAGGTQRLPRLVGPKAALDIILTGRHVPAEEARRLGLLDAVLDDSDDLRLAAAAFARRVADARPLPRVRDRSDRLKEAQDEPGLFDATRKSIARRARNQKAPYRCIDAVEAACALPMDEGLARERAFSIELENSDQARALRYAFFAEREVAKLPDIPAAVAPKDFQTVALVGAGTMGGGIAMSFADFGYPVKIMDATTEALDRGLQKIRDNYATSVRRGSVTEDEMRRRLARIEPVASYDDIGQCDIVIEAALEELEVMKPGALILSNTSGLDIDQLAAMTKRPQDVAGAHFFSPANVMKLLEVVRGAKSSPTTLATVMQMGRKIGKISVMAGNTDGFVANRSRAPFSAEMVILLEEGCLTEQGRQGDGRFRLPDGPLRGRRSRRSRHQRCRPPSPRRAELQLSPAADRRPPRRDRPLRPEDGRRLVSLREGRPHAPPRSRGGAHHQGGGG